ncbi:MAG: VWA domain-containing protein, partial [Candidatus Binatia bacterium]
AGVRLDAVVPPQRSEPDVRIERVIAPPLVAEDSLVPVRVIAHNPGGLRPAVLNLYLDGQIADSAAVELQPGRNALALPTQLHGEGSHRLRAELVVADDATAANNVREIGISISPRTRVLLLAAREQSPLGRALRRKGFTVDIRAPQALRELETLLPYNAVVLEDVAAGALTTKALDHLERYVREHGGGLIVAGGTATYGDAGFTPTALKRLLPVTLEPHRPRPGAREPLALFLVIDRSNSMGYNSRLDTQRDGEKLRYAKEAALAVIGQLKDQDLVGVVAFDSQPHEIAALRPLTANRRPLEDLIPRLVENGGTDFLDALGAARDQLAASRVDRRHIMLITDGDTNRSAPDEYRALIKTLIADKISVTTVRIGDNTVNLQLLRDISSQTGGEFHYVEDAQQLPDLMLRETTRALSPLSPGTEEYFPQLIGEHQLLTGIAEARLPPLAGYAYARPKDGADVLLYVNRLERRDPLLAVWQYGLGRVAAFTASPTDDGGRWVTWPEFSKFWSQVAHWTARDHTDDQYAIDAQRRDGVVEIAIRSFGPTADGATLTARLRFDDNTTREIDLVPRQPRLFTASLLELPAGRYPLEVIKRTPRGTVSQYRGLVTVPGSEQDEQDELLRDTPNRSLLTQLTDATGGTLDQPAHALTERPPGTRQTSYPLDAVLLPLAMLLFLADIAVRQMRRRPGASATRFAGRLQPTTMR